MSLLLCRPNRLFQVSWFGSQRLATALSSHGLSWAKTRFAFLREAALHTFSDQTFST
jgi:hypothetical protein